MERYIKPNCYTVRIEAENYCQIIGNSIGDGGWCAPKREDITTTPSLTQPNVWKEDKDFDSYMEAHE